MTHEMMMTTAMCLFYVSYIHSSRRLHFLCTHVYSRFCMITEIRFCTERISYLTLTLSSFSFYDKLRYVAFPNQAATVASRCSLHNIPQARPRPPPPPSPSKKKLDGSCPVTPPPPPGSSADD